MPLYRYLYIKYATLYLKTLSIRNLSPSINESEKTFRLGRSVALFHIDSRHIKNCLNDHFIARKYLKHFMSYFDCICGMPRDAMRSSDNWSSANCSSLRANCERGQLHRYVRQQEKALVS